MEIESPLLIGSSSAIAGVCEAIRQVADTDATVLIQGETGTGKELVARLIHDHSPRQGKPFVPVNCGGLVPGLTVSELFGHEIGAFTGAVRRRIGRFESAHRGTLFLDEIGELPSDLQPILLRAMETKAIDRVGGDQVPVDVRIVAATNRELTSDVAKGRFRPDLFYRLNVFPIVVPPLRDRLIDVPEITLHFMRHFAAQHNRPATHIPSSSMQLLQQYDWPGNVRELQNIIERAVIASSAPELSIDPSWLARADLSGEPDGRSWAAQERRRILEALRATGGRIYGPSGAAQRLGLRPTTLYGKMRKHGIAKDPSSWE